MDGNNNIFDECCKPEPLLRVASAGCSQDNSAAACLPDDWIPQHSGDILKNYLKQRKEEHDQTIKDMFTDAKELNKKIDDKIKAISETLHADLEQYNNNNTCTLERAKLFKIRINHDKFIEMRRQLQDNYDSILQDINQYKKEALTIERERAEEIKILLRNYLRKLMKIGAHTPRELMEIFDRHIFEANQQLLSNTRTYEELVSQLIVQAYNDLTQAKSCLDQLNLGYSLGALPKEIMPSIDELATPVNSLAESIVKEDSMTADEFNECLQKMLDAYHNAVYTVFTGFYNKFIALEKTMGVGDISILQKVSCANEIRELEELMNKVLNLVTTESRMPSTRRDVSGIQDTLTDLAESLKETYSILHEAGHLFDAHILRAALAQKLHSAGVQDLITNHDSIELSHEVPINILLEQMISSPDKTKVDTYYNSIEQSLNKAETEYIEHSEAEVNAIGKYMMLPKFQGDVLESEIKFYLQKYPRASIVNASESFEIIPNVRSESYEIFPSVSADLGEALPKMLLQTELQASSLLNWKNGFLESFETFISVLQEELEAHARKWVGERESTLNLRYSMKMISHSIRRDRMVGMKEIRLEEINIHEQRLNNHMRALDNFFEEVLENSLLNFSMSSPQLFPFPQWMEQIDLLIDAVNSPEVEPEIKKLKCNSYNLRLIKYKRLFIDSLDTAVDDYLVRLGNEIQTARIANYQYLMNIKLFSEGGSYSASEALSVIRLLSSAGERIEATFDKCKDIVTAERAQLLVDSETMVKNAIAKMGLPSNKEKK